MLVPVLMLLAATTFAIPSTTRLPDNDVGVNVGKVTEPTPAAVVATVGIGITARMLLAELVMLAEPGI